MAVVVKILTLEGDILSTQSLPTLAANRARSVAAILTQRSVFLDNEISC